MLDTEAFHGPIDLLLYLVDREEVDLLLMPLEKIARQYRDFLDLLQIFEVEEVVGYVAMLAKLLEAKSGLVLRVSGSCVTPTPRMPKKLRPNSCHVLPRL